jgi:hypothetical protein
MPDEFLKSTVSQKNGMGNSNYAREDPISSFCFYLRRKWRITKKLPVIT